MGVTSKPVKQLPQYFADFLIYDKTKFVENLKSIGALMRKLLRFQFYTAMYVACDLEFIFYIMMDFKKSCFINFFFKKKKNISELMDNLLRASWNGSDTYLSPCSYTLPVDNTF